MAAVFSPWLRRKISALVRPAKRRPFRREEAPRLILESLEDRTLLTTWQDIAGAFNSGVVNVGAKTTTLANSAFNLSIPLVRSSFSQAVDVPGKLQTPFGLKLDPNATDLEPLKRHLHDDLGFTVERLDVTADGNGDLVRLSKDFPFSAGQAAFSVGGIGGDLGFKYFDDHVAGGLNIGTVQASVPPIAFHVTFGVDLVGTQPQLFLQDSTPDANGKFTGLDPFTITGQTHLTGTMNLRNLLNVQIDGDAILSLSAGLSFKSPDTTSHKLRLDDLTSTNVIGTLSGPRGGQDPALSFANVNLSTQLPILPALKWTGNFFANIFTDASGHKTVTPTETAVTPDIWGTLKGFVSGLLNVTPSLDFLKPIASALNFKIPLFNFTLGDKLGLGDLSKITSLTADINAINNDIQAVETNVLNPIGIYVGIPPGGDPSKQPKNLVDLANIVKNVIMGETPDHKAQDLLSFYKKGGNQWGKQFCFTFLSLGVPGVADVHLDACFGGYVGWDYSVGFGIDTTGFYISPDTHIGVNGGIYAGLHGGLRVLGFDLASADGRIGLDASARLSVRNPDPSQGDRIYLDEIFNGGNLFQSILNALQVDFTMDVTAHVEAKLNLWLATITLFSHDWDLGRLVDVHLAAATTQSKRTMRLNLQNQDLSQDPAVSFGNGVLTLDGRSGTPANPNLVLLSGKDGTVDANWQGHGIGHFTGVTQVKFLGGSGNDRIQVKPGFNIPINAQGGSGSNYFEAGDGNSTLLGGGSAGQRGATLIGGAGQDWLQGGPGDDQIIGGSGDSTLIGGAGSDLLRAGTGNDLLLGGSPVDPAHPERGADPNDPDTGSDTLDGGLKNSTLWAGNGTDTLIAGYGTDQLHGGKGDDLIIAGATVDPTVTPSVVTGGGDDTIWAGAGNNSIRGGQGNDTIYGTPQGTFTVGSDGHLSFTTSVTSHNTIQGGTGNDTIYGGPNSDLLMAGTGNDRLYSDSDVSHKTTLTAGSGEVWLYAGQGDDLLRLPFGANGSGVRSHFVGGPGHDILAITTDDKDHIIRLTQSSATNFTATSYDDIAETQPHGSFNFEVPSDLHGNFIQTLALEAINGNNKLDVAPQVGKNVELIGGTGNDTLIGGGGINTLLGGTGNDSLVGGPGTNAGTYNEFHGGTGSTTMIGGAGDDVFYGGTGDNVMQGGNGRVVMHGGKSLPGQHNHDIMSVGSLNLMVVMIAEANDVTMYGGPGKNVLLGGTGNAEMHAGDGDSVLTASTGSVTMYGGAGYDVLIGGQGSNVLHADDPTRVPPNHSTEDWQTRFDELHDQIAATRAEEDRLTALINNPNTPRDQIPALEAEKAMVIQEDGQIALAIYQLDIHYAPHNQDPNPMTRYYDNPNVLMGGDGPTVIYGSTFPNYILAGNGRTTIYSGGADDTVTGTAGKDTFFVPPAPDNATIRFTAHDDGYGNTIPVVDFFVGMVLQREEKVHSRGITQIGVVASAGDNSIQVNLGSYALYDIAVQCTTGNDRIDLTGFQGGATIQAGSGNDTVVGGSPMRGVELDGGTGLSTYLVDLHGVITNHVEVQTDGSPSGLWVIVSTALQSKITKSTFRRLSVQGGDGTYPITLGPFGNSSFPEVIASAGSGNRTIDASAVSQRVTLLGGTGNDTLIGGSGHGNYFQGGTGDTLIQHYTVGDTVRGGGGTIRYEELSDLNKYGNCSGYCPGTGVPGWATQLVASPAGDSIWTDRYTDPNGNNDMVVFHNMNVTGVINTANYFIDMGAYYPAWQGPISAINESFGFQTFYCSWASDCNVAVSLMVQQRGYTYDSTTAGTVIWLHSGWTSLSWSASDAGSFNLVGPSGGPPHPDFSSSGAPLYFGFSAANANLGATPIVTGWAMDYFHVVVHAAPPNVPTSFRIVPSTLSPIAGSPYTVTVTALDAANHTLPSYRGTVHFNSNDPAGLLPSDYTFTAADNGVHTFNITFKTAGSRTLSVVQSDASFVSGMATVNVLPAAADHFQVTSSANPVTAGSPISLTVRAFDPYGNLATGYRGTVHFTSSDGQATLPADYTFTATDQGVHTFTLTLRTAGNQTVTLRDTANGLTFNQSVTVVAAIAAGFLVTPSTQNTNAGDTLSLTVRAVDTYGNTVTSYRGTVHPPASDGQTTLPPDYPFTAADNGTHTFSLTLTQSYYRTVTITDTNHLTGSTLVRVNPLAAVSLVLGSTQGVVGAGTPLRLTITAYDKYNNQATSYTGTVHFSSGDAQATLPPDYTFTAADQGMKTFTVTFRTAGFQTLQASDGAATPLRASANVAVSAAAAVSFGLVSAGNPITAGTAFAMTVTAYDAFGNVATGYTGTVHFASTNAQETLPADYTFQLADNGVHVFTITLKKAGNQTLTLADTVNPALTSQGVMATESDLSAGSLPHGITYDARDGNFWITEYGGNVIARITPAGVVTEFPVLPAGMAAGDIYAAPDGTLWFYQASNGQLGRLNPLTQEYRQYPVPITIGGMVIGPDGDLWFAGTDNKIYQVNPATGTVLHAYPIPTANSFPRGFTAGPDGNLWFVEAVGNKVGRITTTGVITEFVIPTAGSLPYGITAGPDGNLWFGEAGANKIGRVNLNHTPIDITEFALPTPGSGPESIAAGTDGNLWFAQSNAGRIGRITPAGAVTEFAVPSTSFISRLTIGADGSIWFTEGTVGKVARLAPAMTVLPAAAASLRLTPAANPVDAGVAFTLTVTALDPYGNIDPGYTGTVHFSSSDAQAMLLGDITFMAADHGVHVVSITLKTAGSQMLTALDTVNGSITGTTSVTVRPGAAQSLQLTGLPMTIQAGTSFNVTITALDQFGNVATGYNGTVTFSSQDPYGATLPDDYTFQPTDMGTVTFSGATLYTAGPWDVTVTDTTTGIQGGDLVTVTPAAADHFQIDAPATVAPNMPFDVTVTALDPYGNIDTNYRGTVTFTSSDSDPNVVLPSDYTFMDTDSGIAVFAQGFTLATLGDQSISATDIDSGITGMATVTVQSPGPGASGVAGKGSGAVDGGTLAGSQPATPAGTGAAEGTQSLRLLASLGITDSAKPMPRAGSLAAARPHHALLSRVELLDQLFLEQGLIG
jgi:streptogramin lyase/Ca2+-binding RTX toxin-like protein